LDNIRSIKQDIFLLINNKNKGNNKPGDSENDFYTSGRGVGSNRDNLSNRGRSLGNSKSNIRGALNSLDVLFLGSNDLVDITSAT
jgi:hypothetical protein